MIPRALQILLCFTLVIGPVLLGSYYGDWRWPLLISASLTSLLTVCTLKPQLNKWHALLPALCCLCLIAQGLFQYYNFASTLQVVEFIPGLNIWLFITNPNQPFPNLPGAPDPAQAFDALSYILPTLLFLLATRKLLATRILRLSTLFATIFWTGAAIATLGITQKLTGADSIFWSEALFDRQRPLFFATFRSPGIATCYLNLCLAVGLCHLQATMRRLRYTSRPTPAHPIAITVGLITIFSAATTAGSKAGSVFALATVILWIAANPIAIWHMLRDASSLLPSGSPHERNILIGSLAVAAVLGALSLGTTVSQRWERSIDSNHSTMQIRHQVNAVQLELIQRDSWPLTGYGPGSFYPIFQVNAPHLTNKSLYAYAHNDHLQTLLEWGWFGTACFIVLIGGGATCLLYESLAKRRRHSRRHLYYFRGTAIALFICLLHATVDFPFQIESIAVTIAALIGVAWASPSLRIKRPKRKSKSAAPDKSATPA